MTGAIQVMSVVVFLFQRGGRYVGGGRFSVPYDSTIGVGRGFYWFAAAFLAFAIGGTVKAYLDDRKWRGRFFTKEDKKEKSIDGYLRRRRESEAR